MTLSVYMDCYTQHDIFYRKYEMNENYFKKNIKKYFLFILYTRAMKNNFTSIIALNILYLLYILIILRQLSLSLLIFYLYINDNQTWQFYSHVARNEIMTNCVSARTRGARRRQKWGVRVTQLSVLT